VWKDGGRRIHKKRNEKRQRKNRIQPFARKEYQTIVTEEDEYIKKRRNEKRNSKNRKKPFPRKE
jgi:hypothetical protein